MSGNITRIFRHKKAYGFCNLICAPNSAKGNRLLKLSRVGCCEHVRVYEPGTDGVYSYSPCSHFFRQSLGGCDQPALCGRIVDLSSIARNSGVRHDIYDSTETPSYHWQNQRLSEVEETVQSSIQYQTPIRVRHARQE